MAGYQIKRDNENMGIHDCNAKQGYMLMWDATTAKCGSSEVVSCLQ